jgi:Lipopolysaccharide-assembly
MKSPFQLLAFSSLVALSLGLTGCAGYRLGDVKPSSYVGINTLFIPPFKNETLEPRLSSLVTNAVLKEVQADGTYRVGNRSNSDAILVGVIKDVKKSQLRANRQDTLQSQELILYLYVDFHLEDPQTGAIIGGTIPADGDKSGKTEGTEVILARQGRVMGQTIQFVDPNFQVTERNSLAVAAQDLASKLVGQLANGW